MSTVVIYCEGYQDCSGKIFILGVVKFKVRATPNASKPFNFLCKSILKLFSLRHQADKLCLKNCVLVVRHI